MLEAFSVVGGSVLTLFLLMSAGFLFGRLGLLSGETLSQVSRILLYVVTPSIMITSFEVERTPASQGQLVSALAAMTGVYVVYMLLSQLLFPREGEEHRGILRFAAVYGNAGFMGLPLIQSALGQEAMMAAVVGLAVFNTVTWTQGRALMGGRRELSLKKLALNPGILGFAAGLLLFFTGWRLPGPVDAAVGYLGSMNTPLAMVVIGGRNSSNTTRLAEVCALTCPRTFHIESVDELDAAAFAGCHRIGVTAGASTPENQIASVEAFLKTL